ncbi:MULTISPECIES: hypothetical protein [Sphingobium]|uniref:Uncharacterized protein n=1 Tax=Sphingobium fuliginis (strain ATCC 27551) TaxID=336203 RepID=A0ABQ1F6T6_SPHSA|nr:MULTISPECIES: hypothetical protein [Sphingobium]RYL96268.1 hypothetical protein EWH10_18450 [Sphingobium fuliginis]WDA36203.1 hypothetical protein PO876_22650 [Sphingobium sp. YC-XJ3]GGA01255.1 hypothetical protein GCM10019071_34690 [Sphingobium fuliginis]
MTDSHDAAEDILLAFAVEPRRDSATLERYLKAYPDLADQLIDLSLELRLQHATEEMTAPTDEAWVEASLAAFRVASSSQASEPVVDPFASIKPVELVAIRQSLGVPSGVIRGFSSRLVDIVSVPGSFIDALAQELRTTADNLRRFMAGPPRLELGVRYKADKAPAAEQEKISFEDLLKQNKVPDEQLQRLLASRD